MRRKEVIVLLFIMLLFSTVALLNEADRAEYVSYVDFAGTGPDQFYATAVERIGQSERLKFYHWQEDVLILEQTVAESENHYYQPELLQNGDSQLAITYLEEISGKYRLKLLLYANGQWREANYGRPLDVDSLSSVHTVCSTLTERFVYLAYQDAQNLYCLRVDQQTGENFVLYEEALGMKVITGLTMVEANGDPVLAYTYGANGQQNLHTARIRTGGYADWCKEVEGALGYDLTVKDGHIYLAYDQQEGTTARVHLVELNLGNYVEMGTFVRQDATPDGLKLLHKGAGLALVYREEGVTQEFHLYETHLANGVLTAPELLIQEGSPLELTSLRRNLQEWSAGTLALFNRELYRMARPGEKLFRLIDTAQTIPAPILAAGTGRSHQQVVTLQNNLTPAMVRNVNLQKPAGMVKDSEGYLYVVDEPGKVWKIYPDGRVADVWELDPTNVYSLTDVVFDGEGYLNIVDSANDQILRFATTGQIVDSWGAHGSEPGQFNCPVAIAKDREQNLYILDQGNARVQKFDAQRNLLAVWGTAGAGTGELNEPTGIAVDLFGRVYIADTGNHRIQVFTVNGNYLTAVGLWGQDAGQMIEPVDLEIAGDQLYVLDRGNHRVQVFTLNLDYLYEFGERGGNWGQFAELQRIFIDANYNIYITDGGNRSLLQIAGDDQLIAGWRGGDSPEAYTALESVGRVAQTYYYFDRTNQWILAYDANLNFLRAIQPADSTERILASFAVNADYIYCTDLLNHAVVIYDHAGNLVGELGGRGNQPGEFNQPMGICVDAQNYLYVADTGNHRIQVFDPEGHFFTQWGSFGAADGQLMNPESINIQADTIRVVDQAQQRVQAFDRSGRLLQKWSGLGAAEGQLSYVEYIEADLAADGGFLPTAFSYSFGLSDDTIPRKSKSWSWEDKFGYGYRYKIDQSSGSSPSGSFTNVSSASVSGGNGDYYLHIQAAKYFIFKVDESYVYHYKAVLDNTVPTVTMPASSTLPQKSLSLSWSGADNIQTNNTINYRSILTTNPVAEWSSSQWSQWNGLAYDATTSLSVASGEGARYLTVQAVDRAGNYSEMYSRSFILDNTAPTVLEPLKERNGDQLTITLQGSDTGSASLCYRYVIDDSTNTAPAGQYATQTVYTVPYPDHPVYLHVQAIDEAGNASAVYHTLLDLVDIYPPEVTGLQNQDQSVKSWTWSWSAIDNKDQSSAIRYRYLIDAAPVSVLSGTYGSATSATLQNRPDGKYYISLQTVDQAGNASTVYHAYATLDNTAPQVYPENLLFAGTKIAGLNLYCSEVDVTIPANAYSDAGGVQQVWYKLDQAVYQTYTAPFAVTTEGHHTLMIKVQDVAGNFSEATREFTIDMSAPVLSGLNLNFYTQTWFNTAQTIALTAADAYSAIQLVEYNLNNTGWNTLTNGAQVQVVTEGVNQLQVRMTDQAGNQRTTTVLVQIDYTRPVMGTIQSAEHLPDRWTYLTDASFSLTATDQGSGIAGYYYVLDGTLDTTITPGPAVAKTTTSQLELHALPDGVLYLHALPFDKAGNVGAQTVHYQLLVAAETPLAPVIISDTHIERGSSDYRRAHFMWDTPACGTYVGVDHYEYTFAKVVSGTKVLLDYGTTSQNEIAFDDLSVLPDVNDLYIFALLAVNAAGEKGPLTEYQFKVADQTDLTTLAVRSDTHPSGLKYYKNNQAHFYWNHPENLPGIAYEYQWNETGVLDPADWQGLAQNEALLTVDNTRSSTYYFWVRGTAEEEVYTSERRAVRLDFAKPALSDFHLTLDPARKEAVVYWGSATDAGGSGVSDIKVHLFAEGDERGWYRAGLNDGEYTFQGIQSDKTYTVELVVADAAGNRRIRAARFNLLTGVDYAVGQVEEFTIDNWQVQGVVYDDQIANVKITLPVAYQFKVKEGDSYQFVDQLTFVTAEKTGDQITAAHELIEYQVTLSGQTFLGQGVYLDSTGFYLQRIWLNTPEAYWRNASGVMQPENQQVQFSGVEIAALGGNKAAGTYLEEKTDCVYREEWPLTIARWVLNDCSVSLCGTVDLRTAYVTTPVNFTGLEVNQDLLPTSGSLASGYLLELAGRSELSVTRSRLFYDHILIEEAWMNFTDVNGQHAVKLGNFTIDRYDLITKLDTFYSAGFNYTFGAITYSFAANQLDFSGGSLMAKSGTASIGGVQQTFDVAYVPLENKDADLIKDAPIFTRVEKWFDGIRVEGLSGYVVGDQIHFTTCKIYLPMQEEETGDPVILTGSNLIYTQNDTFDFSALQLSNSRFTYNGFAILDVSGIRVSGAGGLELAGLVEFAEFMPGGLCNETFPIHTSLLTGEGIQKLEVNVPEGRPLTLYDTYEFTAGRIYFLDDEERQSIYFTGGTVQYVGVMANKLSSDEVANHIVEIDTSGQIVKFDNALQSLYYELLGMQVSIYTEHVDATTISYGGSVRLPAELPGSLSGLELCIHNLQIDHHTGEIVSFSAYIGDGRPIEIAGWNFELYGITFVENLIRFSAAIQVPETGKVAEVMPDFAGKYININEFCLSTAGEVASFDVKIPLEFRFELIAGIQAGAYELGVSLTGGRLENLTLGFTRTAVYLPEDLGGGTLSVDNLRINFQGQLNYDQIELTNQKLPFKDVAEVYIERATLKNQGADTGLNIQGTVTLGATFPEGLKDRTFLINELLITSEGITRFDVGIDLTKPIQIFKAVEFSAARFSFTDSGFAIDGGSIRFINEFATTVTAEPVLLHTFRISYTGNIEEFDAEFGNIDFDLIGCRVDVDSLRFTKTNVSFDGAVTLPAQLPGELSSLTIAISELVINYSGQVETFNIQTVSPLNFDLNGLKISLTTLQIDQSGFSMAATCTLPDAAALPAELRGLPVSLSNLRIDRSFVVQDFTLSVDRTVSFPMDKLTFEISKLTFTKQNFAMAGAVILPDTFPGTLKSMRINFNEFKMSYHGQVLSTDISISKLDFNLGSYFNASIYDFGFEVLNGQSRLKARSLVVGVQSPINTTINFTDLSIDNQGQFSAKVQPNFTVDIPVAGVTLRLKEPNFNCTGVSVASAELLMPNTLGSKKVAVYGVTIDPEQGLQIQGGEFGVSFPNMALGGVGIQNAYMTLKIDSGKYAFEGNGKVFIPTIGEIEANLKLRTKDTDYPSGIERIYLSFQSAGLGLALGTTGLYINGVSGEFADGPVPADSAPVVQRIGGGMRFNFNIYLRDVTGGLRGQTGFWININNYNAAVTGRVSLLNNLVSTDVYAAICDHFRDFYAEANISILAGLVQGNSSFHVWKAGGTSYLTGSARVSVVISRGMVYNGRFIKIPGSKMTIGNIGAEFGNFRNGVKGVKGYTSLPIVGQVGFFAGNIGFKIGGVSQYVLMNRMGTEFMIVQLDQTQRMLMDQAIVSMSGNFIIDDKEYISFVLPGEAGLPRNDKFALAAKPAELKDYYVQSTERLVFAVGFDTGDPELIAIGPDGMRYTKDTPGVEYTKEAEQILLSIPDPLPGNWHVELANVTGLDYQVMIMGTTPKPELVFTTPTFEKENGSNRFTISGRGGTFSGKECFVDLYYDSDNANFDGQLIAEGVPLNDFTFDYAWDTTALPSGEYYIYGKLYDDGEMPPVLAYAPGSVEVSNYQPLLPPAFVQAVRVDGMILVEWEQALNSDVVGYTLHYGSESGNYTEALNIGLVNATKISAPTEETCYLAITAYNAMLEESAYSPEVLLEAGSEPTLTFNLNEVQNPAEVHLYIGEGEEVAIPYSAVGFPAGDLGDYFTAQISGLPEGVYAQFDKPLYHLYAEEPLMQVRFLTEAENVPVLGEKNQLLLKKAEPLSDGMVTLTFTSCGNPDLQITKELQLVCEHRMPELYEVTPREGINNAERELTLTGDNFREGAAVYLDKAPLTVTSLSKNVITALVPAGFAPGNYEVRVVQDDGQAVGIKDCYQVQKPYFTLEPLQGRLLIARGGVATVYLTAAGFNEFSGAIQVESGKIPAGFWLMPENQTLIAGGEVAFEISAGYELTPGEYLLDFIGTANGEQVSCKVNVEVVEGDLRPEIVSFNKPFAVTTEPVVVYGQGFGHSGNLYLNGGVLPVSSWSSNRIEFTVPAGCETGDLVVEAGGMQSNAVRLVVKEKQYSITLHPTTILINRGDAKEISFAITGFSDPIDFSIEGLPKQIVSQFTNQAVGVKPNYTLRCTLTTDPGMDTGEYRLMLVGRMGDNVKEYPFTVKVADLPQVQNFALAGGRVGVPYAEDLIVEGGFTPYHYEILHNSLPAGLGLDQTGRIAGVPKNAGTYYVNVSVTDAAGSVTEAELKLNVMTDEWIYPDYDEGGWRNSRTAGPANADEGFAVELGAGAGSLMSSEEQIIRIAGRTLQFFAKADGAKVNELTLAADVRDAISMKDQLLLVLANGELVSYAYGTAGFATVDSGLMTADDLALDRDQVLLVSGERMQLRRMDNLRLEDEVLLPYARNTQVKGVLAEHVYYYLDTANRVVALELPKGSARFLAPLTGTVVRLQADAVGLLVVSADGTVQRLSADGQVSFVLAAGKPVQHLIPYEAPQSGYVVSDGTTLELYAGGKPYATRTGSYQQMLVAGNRLYTVGTAGVAVYKLSNLQEVWSAEVGAGSDLIIGSGKLYVLAGGKLLQYVGPSNAFAPETTLITKPQSPDGRNGFFRQDVSVELEATDRDNEVGATYYALNNGEFGLYGKALTIGEGIHQLSYYSIDQASKMETVKTTAFQVDYTPPVVSLEHDPVDGDNGYYRSAAVGVTLVAEDQIAGVEAIYYAIDGGAEQIYCEPFTVSGDGEHTVRYYATDLAGNVSEAQLLTLRIDTTLPEVVLTAEEVDGANGYYQKDPVMLWLTAEDHFSGIAAIYYTLDGSAEQVYTGQIVVQGEGIHSVQYYAIDRAGNRSVVGAYEVRIDHTVPELTLTPKPVNGKNGYYVTAPVQHILTATDNLSGVDKLYYQIDAGEFQLYEDEILVSGDGAHEIRYYGVDLAGNTTAAAVHALRIDTVAPVSSVTQVKPVVNGLYVWIRLAATDNYSQVATLHYQVDAGAAATTEQDIYLTEPGEHTVTFYAEDVAGNLETPQTVTCYVESLAEIAWIDQVELTEFHNGPTAEQPWEIDRKVEVGDRIYLDDTKYLFDKVPDFLQGARYLRTNRQANTTGSEAYYLKLAALVNLKVYMVVESTITSVPGFTLVGQATFANKMQFKSPHNVFMKQLSGNSLVEIPAKALMDVGFAPLIFYTFDDSKLPFACIEELTPVKRDGQWFLDWTAYGYDSETGMIPGENLRWNCTADGVEILSGSGEAGSIPVEFRAEPYRLELTLTATNAAGEQGLSQIFRQIVDRSGLYIDAPADRARYTSGEPIVVRGRKLDEMGQPVAATLTWEWRHDNATGWQLLGTGETLTLTAPEQSGNYELRLSDGSSTAILNIVVQNQGNGGKKTGKK